MQYRKFKSIGWEVSALGYGCMRLPSTDGMSSSGNIDVSLAVRMIRQAIEGGVNYVDSAYVYHRGQSEVVLGKALADGWRDKVKVATKAPMILVKNAADYNRILDEQLVRLGIETIDFYLFHGLGKNSWQTVKDQELLVAAEAAQKAGKIKHICFSFHDDYEVYEEIINGYDKWSMAQIQYNFMDTNHQAGRKGLELAASKGIDVVVMEPLRGGKLARPLPEVAAIMAQHGYTGTLADLAFRWVWDQEAVSVAISGMSTVEQIEQNLVSADASGIGTLTQTEFDVLAEIKALYESREGVPCTACSYCMPCPEGVNIPGAFDMFNDALVYDFLGESIRIYNLFGKPASKCIQCGVCLDKCPQKIDIPTWMAKIDAALAE
jgi:predicted aldo/keto reductase-like oxidoreductase